MPRQSDRNHAQGSSHFVASLAPAKPLLAFRNFQAGTAIVGGIKLVFYNEMVAYFFKSLKARNLIGSLYRGNHAAVFSVQPRKVIHTYKRRLLTGA